jgi:hypothetical protein
MQQKLFAAIDQYQEDVFEYRPAEMAASFMAMVDALEYWVANIFRPEANTRLNRLLEVMLTAYQNKDYLLVADLAEYELKPLALSAVNGRIGHDTV